MFLLWFSQFPFLPVRLWSTISTRYTGTNVFFTVLRTVANSYHCKWSWFGRGWLLVLERITVSFNFKGNYSSSHLLQHEVQQNQVKSMFKPVGWHVDIWRTCFWFNSVARCFLWCLAAWLAVWGKPLETGKLERLGPGRVKNVSSRPLFEKELYVPLDVILLDCVLLDVCLPALLFGVHLWEIWTCLEQGELAQSD